MEKADGVQLMYIIPVEFGKSTKNKTAFIQNRIDTG